MKLSVVVPVFNGSDELCQCLRALREGERPPDEIIVVDDASSDDSAQVGRDFGARMVSLEGKPHGPAVARNRGADVAQGDIIVFLDADVVVHADTLSQIESTFEHEPEVGALFGSYDDAPRDEGLISRYYNLRHHWTHQHGQHEASTFWSGCGAIRRAVFEEVGGFDESYTRPSMEDIALGGRLRAARYRIRLRPEIQATHLKRWTLRSWLCTDIWGRAVPWTQMLVRQPNAIPADLNLDWKSRLSAIAVWGVVLLLLAGFAQPVWWMTALTALGVALGLNWPILRFFAARGGAGFAVGAALCHGLYYLYSSATFALVTLSEKSRFDSQNLYRFGYAVLLVAALFKGLAWSLIVPPWQAPDEPQHYLYAYEIGRQGRTSIAPSSEVPSDAWQLAVLSPHYKHLPGQALDLSDLPAVHRSLWRLDHSRGERVQDDGHLLFVKSFTNFHPPLYFAALSSVLQPVRERGIRQNLLAARWFSVGLGLVTVMLAVGIGNELWPRCRSCGLLLGLLVAFQPMNAFTQATVTNDAALIALFSVLLLVGLRVLRAGMNIGRGLMLALVLTAGLMVKMSFACAVPLVGGLLVWRLGRERRVLFSSRHRPTMKRMGSALSGWALCLLLPVGVCAPWYLKTLGGGSQALLQSSFVEARRPAPLVPPAGSVKPLSWERKVRHALLGSGLTIYIVKYTRVFVSYWGNFGWVNVRVPSSVWIALLAVSLGVIGLVPRRLVRAKSLFSPVQRRALWWLGAGTLALGAFFAFVDWRTLTSTGGHFGLRGGYYLPAIAGQMAWLLVAVAAFSSPKRRLEWGLAAAMVALNFYCLFGVVGPCYYSVRTPWEIANRAAILQPASPMFMSLVCTAMGVTSVLLLVLLRAVLHADSAYILKGSPDKKVGVF